MHWNPNISFGTRLCLIFTHMASTTQLCIAKQWLFHTVLWIWEARSSFNCHYLFLSLTTAGINHTPHSTPHPQKRKDIFTRSAYWKTESLLVLLLLFFTAGKLMGWTILGFQYKKYESWWKSETIDFKLQKKNVAL